MIGNEMEVSGSPYASGVGVGMKVRTADGTVLGKVTEVLADRFRVEKGIVFRHGHLVKFEEVGAITGDVVILRDAMRGMTVPPQESPWYNMNGPEQRQGEMTSTCELAPGRGHADDPAYSTTRAELYETHPTFPTGLIETGDGVFEEAEDAPVGLPERVHIAEPEDTMVDIDGRGHFFRPVDEDTRLVDTDNDGRSARPEDAGKVDSDRSQSRLVDTDNDGRDARPEDAGKVDGGFAVTEPRVELPADEKVDTYEGRRMARAEEGWVATSGTVTGIRSGPGAEPWVDSDNDGRFAPASQAGIVDGTRAREALSETGGRYSTGYGSGDELVDTDGDGRFARPEDAGKVDGWRALDASAGAESAAGSGSMKKEGEEDLEEGKTKQSFFARSEDDEPSHR